MSQEGHEAARECLMRSELRDLICNANSTSEVAVCEDGLGRKKKKSSEVHRESLERVNPILL